MNKLANYFKIPFPKEGGMNENGWAENAARHELNYSF